MTIARIRDVSRYLVAFLASVVGGMAFARPLQVTSETALQAAAVMPTGRVCIVKHLGGATPEGKLEPIWNNTIGAIVMGADGNFYSTSAQGGAYGAGTIFRFSPKGEVKVLHPFINYNRDEGAGPQSGLVDGHDGYYYGTTYGGGHFGVGTIFRIRPDQTKPEILWNFRNGSTIGLWPDCPDHRCPYTGRQRADIAAAYPQSAPVVRIGGVLYGVTGYSNNQGFGVFYKFSPPYDSTSFHALCIFDQRMLADTAMKTFVCKAKSTYPYALIGDAFSEGLYGTTLGGNGTVFRASGGEVTTIHEFDLTHGSKPYNLMLASNGKLYGTTANGGDTGGGIVYSLDTSGDGLLGGGFRVMTSFRLTTGTPARTIIQAVNPVGGLVEVKPRGSVEPFLFGTAKFGGRNGRGILFRIPLEGDSTSMRVLHEFDFYNTGRTPSTAPVLGPTGLLYGVTYQGGTYDSGVIYTLDPIVLNDQWTHDVVLGFGVKAVDDNKVLISDPIAQVWTDVPASQSGTDSTGTVVTVSKANGIMVRGFCPNAHIVQFVYRQRISPAGKPMDGLVYVRGQPLFGKPDLLVAESYPLTTDLNDIHWRSDSPKFAMGQFEQRNAYFDQGNGAGHSSTPGLVAIWDRPSFGIFTDPEYPSNIYLPEGQNTDLTKSETWRLVARDFLVCNCQVTKEIWWAREVRGAKATYTHIKIVNPAPDAFTWINAHLKADGYAPIP